MITRFAPTPSGYLHLGNAAHLRLLAMMAEENGWSIRLRLDDLDPDRTRPEYVDDIFDLVEWLEVPIEGDVYRQSERGDHYSRARDELVARGAYVCSCSRTDWAQHSGPGCPRGCSDLELRCGENALRMNLGDDDIVAWRREGIAAYHLASIVDDDLMGITHVVRGEDLAESTRVQKLLARHLTGNRFAEVNAIHHPLISDESGGKLSKSAGAQGMALPRSQQTRDDIERVACSWMHPGH